MLAMKNKDKLTASSEETSSEKKPPRGSAEETPRTKDDNKSKEEAVSNRNIRDRARKGYHHDGPGGSYGGY